MRLPVQPDRPNASVPFNARYPGECAEGDRIEVDDLVVYIDGELHHVPCDHTARARETVCGTCWLTPCDGHE